MSSSQPCCAGASLPSRASRSSPARPRSRAWYAGGCQGCLNEHLRHPGDFVFRQLARWPRRHRVEAAGLAIGRAAPPTGSLPNCAPASVTGWSSFPSRAGSSQGIASESSPARSASAPRAECRPNRTRARCGPAAVSRGPARPNPACFGGVSREAPRSPAAPTSPPARDFQRAELGVKQVWVPGRGPASSNAPCPWGNDGMLAPRPFLISSEILTQK
jgi:hypothetical protein